MHVPLYKRHIATTTYNMSATRQPLADSPVSCRGQNTTILRPLRTRRTLRSRMPTSGLDCLGMTCLWTLGLKPQPCRNELSGVCWLGITARSRQTNCQRPTTLEIRSRRERKMKRMRAITQIIHGFDYRVSLTRVRGTKSRFP